jgi:hypothetical protein
VCPVACGYPAAAGNRRGPALGGYRLRQRVDRGVPSAAVCWVDAELPPALVDLPLDGLGRRAEFVDEGLADRLGRDWESVQPEEDLEQARVLGVLAPSQQRERAIPLPAARSSAGRPTSRRVTRWSFPPSMSPTRTRGTSSSSSMTGISRCGEAAQLTLDCSPKERTAA